MAFYCIPCWRYSALSQHFHGPLNACTAFTLRWPHVEDAVTSLIMPLFSVQTPWMTKAFAQQPLCSPVELLLHCRRSYCVAMVTLRHCAHIRMLSNGICSKCVPSFGVLCNPTASTGNVTVLLQWCLRSHIVHLGVLHFSWTPWDSRENAALAWQGFKIM